VDRIGQADPVALTIASDRADQQNDVSVTENDSQSAVGTTVTCSTVATQSASRYGPAVADLFG